MRIKGNARTEISLDNTLRYLYNALRYRGGRLLAIEFKHGGQIWRADTVDEAIELRTKLEKQDFYYAIDEEEPPWTRQDAWTPDAVTELLQNVGDNQKDLLKALFDNLNGVTSDELVKALKLDSEVAFAGVLSGLSKQLKKLDIKTWELYTVKIHWKLKRKVRTFELSHNFRWAAQELGWPENWI